MRVIPQNSVSIAQRAQKSQNIKTLKIVCFNVQFFGRVVYLLEDYQYSTKQFIEKLGN
jgi:hypothetical protein